MPPLPKALQNLEPQKLALNVNQLGKAHLEDVLKGINLYQSYPYERIMPEPPVVWRRGSSRLLAYYPTGEWVGEGEAPTILFVPSLINKYYILDLSATRSLVRYLTSLGCNVLVLEWGDPGEEEKGFAIEDYVLERLVHAIRFAHETSGQKITLAGYCMGGVLALAAALLQEKCIEKLALFAAPWDFFSADVNTPRLDPFTLSQMEELLSQEETLSPEYLQLMFYWADPWLFADKFRRFGTLKEGSPAFREFLALEHWVNDGVPLTAEVARQCIIDWSQRNILAKNQWKCGGKLIRPSAAKWPVFLAAPLYDRIVPPGCAMAVADELEDVTLCEPQSGHVGMMVGSKAKKELWEPFADWLTLQRSI